MKFAEFTTRVLFATVDESLRGDCETEFLLHLKDEITGAEGHLRHVYISNEGEHVADEITIDNPALFDRQHPEDDRELTDYAFQIIVTAEHTPEIEAIIAKCTIPVIHKAGDPNGATYEGKKWGLYCN